MNSPEAVTEWAEGAAEAATSGGDAKAVLDEVFEQAEHGEISASDARIADVYAELQNVGVPTCFQPRELSSTDAIAENLLEVYSVNIGADCAGDLFYGRFDRTSSRDAWLSEQAQLGRPAWQLGDAAGVVAVDVLAGDVSQIRTALNRLQATTFDAGDTPVAASLAEWFERTAGMRSSFGRFALEAAMYGCRDATGEHAYSTMTWSFMQIVDGINTELSSAIQEFGATAQALYDAECESGTPADLAVLDDASAKVEAAWDSQRGTLPSCLLACNLFRD